MKNKRILIVDDDLDLLSLLDWHLNRSGYKTGAAVDGREAIKKIREFKPDMESICLTTCCTICNIYDECPLHGLRAPVRIVANARHAG